MSPILKTSVLAAALMLAACKQTAPETTKPVAGDEAKAVNPARPAPASADDNLNAVVWMQRSAEYAAVTETLYRAAAARLDAALKSDEDALAPEERGNASRGLPPAIIMDVDETVLDNSPYQARLVVGGGEFDDLGWDQWVAEKKARPVPGVVAFAQAAAAKGITVLYVSNRATHLKAATLANLKAEGLPVKNDEVFLGLGTFVPDCEQIGSEKRCRRKLAGQKYRVLMQFGDQLGDFVQILTNTPEGRAELSARHADWWGRRWFMLPNPSYGSWEPALFNNEWKQPREARRAAKRSALLQGK
ncbi:acid phosphatase [Lysobacter pythonis]|uniref:Acid phosphatase n=1 Tax=Solilutibacter pythonis TaxID=2483112 RepID=A0A3M2HDY3_9GAMM|nr:HAD family acid phosphatase [Lysobacter pythonis]RMH87921.1 acid phosphatase [Lysobacter pythonis]